MQETSTPERNRGDSVSPESTGGDNVSPESNGDNDVSPESTGGDNVSPESNEDNVSPADLPPPPQKKRRLLQFSGPVHGMVNFLFRPKVQGGLELQHSTAEKTKEKLLGESHAHTHTHTLTHMYIHVSTHFFLFRLQFTSVSSIVSLTMLRLWLMPLTSRCSGISLSTSK